MPRTRVKPDGKPLAAAPGCVRLAVTGGVAPERERRVVRSRSSRYHRGHAPPIAEPAPSEPAVRGGRALIMNPDRMPPSGSGESGAPLYGPSPGLQRFPVGNATELVYCPYDGTRHMLSAADASVLQACGSFSPLPEHARRSRDGAGLDEAAIGSSLQRLVDAGLLVSQQALTARCLAQGTDDRAPARIASVCVPTRNRPAMLLRCLESYLQCGRNFSRRLDVVVADSSDDRAVCAGNVEALAALAKRFGVDVLYLGADEKRDFARRLVAQGVEPGAVDFAVLNPEGCPNDTGTQRNALLLATVDQCTVQVDDDTVCRVMPWLAPRTGVRFTSNFNPTEYVFLDENETIPADRFEGLDFFALHEMLLARSAGELIARHGLATQGFEQPTARLFQRIEGGGARVALTQLGVAGDSGMASSTYFLNLDGELRENLTRSERVYRSALSVHRLIRAARQLSVSDDAFCMGLNLGLDNRRLLPPFMPVQRREDDIFSALLRSSAEGSCFGFLPWALAHDPGLRKRPSIAERSARLHSGDIVHAIVRSFTPLEAKGPQRNLFKLGELLCDLARAPAGDFAEFVRVLAWRQTGRQIALVESLLQKHQGLPQYWAADARGYIATLQESVARRSYIVPLDLELAFGADSAMARMQRLVLRLGELLKAWPALREAARQVRGSAIRVGRRV